jgi:hypothetical protein
MDWLNFPLTLILSPNVGEETRHCVFFGVVGRFRVWLWSMGLGACLLQNFERFHAGCFHMASADGQRLNFHISRFSNFLKGCHEGGIYWPGVCRQQHRHYIESRFGNQRSWARPEEGKC